MGKYNSKGNTLWFMTGCGCIDKEMRVWIALVVSIFVPL